MKNIPNILTIFRIIIVPLFIYLIFQNTLAEVIAGYGVFILASFTDYLDGYIARKYGVTSRFGAFLDPLSDKILTGSAFIAFVIMKIVYFPAWIAAVIILREVIVTIFRILAIKIGKEMKTEFAGKLKTAFQMFSINIILIYMIIFQFFYEKGEVNSVKVRADILNSWIGIAGLPWAKLIFYTPFFLGLICALLSLISMILYIVKNSFIFKKIAHTSGVND